MNSEIILVTPEIAAHWLAANTYNRPLRKSLVIDYARQMKAGEWLVTHQQIAFTGNLTSPGRLIDGQHRLSAVIQSGASVRMSVAFGVEEKTFAVTDRGASRSAGDCAEIPKVGASVMTMLSVIHEPSARRISAAQLLKLWAIFKPFHEMLRAGQVARLSRAPVQAAWVFKMAEDNNNAEKLAGYFDLFCSRNYKSLPDSLSTLAAAVDKAPHAGRSANVRLFLVAIYALDRLNEPVSRIRPPNDALETARQRILKLLAEASPLLKSLFQ